MKRHMVQWVSLVCCLNFVAVASATDFVIDAGSSTLSINPVLDFQDFGVTVPITGQYSAGYGYSYNGSDGLTTSLAGTLRANVDTAGGSIDFGGGSSIVAQTSGYWYPGYYGNTSYGDYGNFGGYLNLGPTLGIDGTALTTIRDFAMDSTSAAAMPLLSDGSGNFNFSSTQQFNTTSGHIDYQGLTGVATLLGAGYTYLPNTPANNAAADGAYSISSGGIAQLTVPINSSLSISLGNLQVVGPTTTDIQFTGTIHAYAAVPGTFGIISDLGNLGQDGTCAFGINNAGQVVGYSHAADGSQQAFVWQHGTMTALPNSSSFYTGGSVAYAINYAGQIVGSSLSNSGYPHATSWHNGTPTDLGTLGNAYGSSTAYAINDFGKIAGSAANSTGSTHPTLWQNGTTTDLGNPLGTVNGSAFGQANAISLFGKVAGTENLGQNNHAFSMAGTVPTSLPSLEGPFGNTNALAINLLGHIVGSSSIAAGYGTHAALWQNGTVTDLGVLAGGGTSQANAINNLDWIVGSSDSYYGTHAVLWHNGQMVDLNSLLPADSGWVLVSAQGINKNDEIVGYGYRVAPNGQSLGGDHAFMLDASGLAAAVAFAAVPEPSTLLLSAMALVGVIAFGGRRVRRAN